MGAEIGQILFLTSRNYIFLSVVAFLVASPFSWYIMQEWLSDFQYAISLDWKLFVAAMLGGLLITLITVGYHSIKSSVINPVDTLRYE